MIENKNDISFFRIFLINSIVFILATFFISSNVGAKTEMQNNQNSEEEPLIVFANSQEKLENALREASNVTKAHFYFSCGIDFDLSVIGKLNDLQILTIEFPAHSEIGVHGDCGFFLSHINLSFLRQIPQLQFLVIDWSGIVINHEAILELKDLNYARLPFAAFSPAIFKMESLQQLEIGDRSKFVMIKGMKESKKLELKSYGYSDQFNKSNKSLKRFKRTVRKKSDEVQMWPEDYILYSEKEEIILKVEGIYSDSVSWAMKEDSIGILFSGYSVNRNGNHASKRLLSRYEIKRITEINDDHLRIVWKEMKYFPELFDATYKEENYTDSIKDGLFILCSDNEVFLEEKYDDGVLTYQFPYTGKIPTLPDFDYLEHFQRISKEAYFKDGKLSLLKTRFANEEREANVWKVNAPIKDNQLHGLLYMLSASSDTLLSIVYKKGKLDGRYYYYSESVSDTVKVYDHFSDGMSLGQRTTLRTHTTSLLETDNGFFKKHLTYRNSDKQKMKEIVWDDKEKVFLEKSWAPDGRLAKERILDEKKKIVLEKLYIENRNYLEIIEKP